MNRYLLTWEESPPQDYGRIFKEGMESMYGDMKVEIIQDNWKKYEAKLTSKNSAKEVKCDFYDVFIQNDYRFRNLEIKKIGGN